MSGVDFEAAHAEVLAALQAIGFPALRARVKQGFSFSKRPADEVLAVWDALWQRSPVGDMLFAALAHCEPIVRKQVPPML